MTSVGSGSLIIVMLMLIYPQLSAQEMVGTDLIQAIPLVAAAALGHYLFGTLDISIITSVLLGAIPAVMVGAHFSSRSADRYIRPVLVAVLTISALGLLGVTNGWLLAAAIVSVVLLGVVYVTMRRTDVRAARSRARGAGDGRDPGGDKHQFKVTVALGPACRRLGHHSPNADAIASASDSEVCS